MKLRWFFFPGTAFRTNSLVIIECCPCHATDLTVGRSDDYMIHVYSVAICAQLNKRILFLKRLQCYSQRTLFTEDGILRPLDAHTKMLLRQLWVHLVARAAKVMISIYCLFYLIIKKKPHRSSFYITCSTHVRRFKQLDQALTAQHLQRDQQGQYLQTGSAGFLLWLSIDLAKVQVPYVFHVLIFVAFITS